MPAGRPQVLVGDTRSRELIARLKTLGWGRMFSTSLPKPHDGEPWGFDTGIFACWNPKTRLFKKPWDELRFLTRLECTEGWDPPLVAILPDWPGRPESWFCSQTYIELYRQWDLPCYLALQDGMPIRQVVRLLPKLDGLFLGGSNEYKAREAAWWCRLAHDAGKRFHYGRAGTRGKLEHAIEIGADSLDSAFPLWSWERFDQFVRWYERATETSA